MNVRVISFHYTVTDAAGNRIDSSAGRAPLTVLEGSGQIIPGLERALSAMKSGEKNRIAVAAAEAYGERNDSLVTKVERTQFPKQDVQVGERYRGGDEHGPILVVTEVDATHVTLDANHPLAGQDLTFEVEITQIREATEQELRHGHAHGEHGHSH